MLYDFERLYVWKKKRRFRSAVDVLIILPKEVDIPSMIEFYQGPGRLAYPDFTKYVEWFGGRLAVPEDDLPCIDLDAEVNRASWAWLTRNVDTKKIGVKEYVPIEETIRENERRQLESLSSESEKNL